MLIFSLPNRFLSSFKISRRREALLSLTIGKVCFKSPAQSGIFKSRTTAADLHFESEIFGKAFAA